MTSILVSRKQSVNILLEKFQLLKKKITVIHRRPVGKDSPIDTEIPFLNILSLNLTSTNYVNETHCCHILAAFSRNYESCLLAAFSAITFGLLITFVIYFDS